MEIKYCPNCDRRVLPRTDGSCPSCHAAFNDDCSGSNAPEPSRFSHTPRTKSRHATLVIIGALILVASVIFLVIPKHPEDGKSIHVDNASLVIVQASGLNRFYGQTAMSLQGNSIGGAEQPPGSSAVFIVRDFDGLGDHVLNQMKRDGVKKGKAYSRYVTRDSNSISYTYICDVDLKLSDQELCEQFGLKLHVNKKTTD